MSLVSPNVRMASSILGYDVNYRAEGILEGEENYLGDREFRSGH